MQLAFFEQLKLTRIGPDCYQLSEYVLGFERFSPITGQKAAGLVQLFYVQVDAITPDCCVEIRLKRDVPGNLAGYKADSDCQKF